MKWNRACFLIFGVSFCAMLADHLLFLDPATGYPTLGIAFSRYLALLAAGLLLAGAIRLGACRRGLSVLADKGYKTLLFWLCTLCFLLGGAAGLLAGQALLVTGLFLLAGSVFFASCALKKPPFLLGILGWVCCLQSCITYYLVRPASQHHVFYGMGLLGQICCLLFFTCLLRTVFFKTEQKPRQLAFWGLASGLLGPCAVVARLLVFCKSGNFTWFFPVYDLPAFALGLLGLYCAGALLWPPKKQQG
ncbi:MAG: hypothetical protein MSH10_04365 [Pygmaiobacter massiliensis]|nr:hypothetical protein [Pygmaiobacter massiliensis]